MRGVSPTLGPCPCFCPTTDIHRIDVASGHRQCVRAAKEMDSKSIGLCPQGFESPRCRLRYARIHVKERFCACAPVKITKAHSTHFTGLPAKWWAPAECSLPAPARVMRGGQRVAQAWHRGGAGWLVKGTRPIRDNIPISFKGNAENNSFRSAIV